MPVLLAYSGGGVKVADIASWVGLGWNLQAGGLVTRTINWLPDDGANGYINNPYDLAQFNANPDSGPACCNPNEQGAQLLGHMVNVRDYEPDEFNFSVPGYSGTFYYDQNLSEFVQIQKTNIKIETQLHFSSERIIGFTITTPNGVKYHFGGSSNYLEAIERIQTWTLAYDGAYTSESNSYSSATIPYYQSWMLREIELPNSDKKVLFDYESEHNIKTINKSDEEFVAQMWGQCDQQYNIYHVEKKYTQPRIKEIVFPGGKITFEKSLVERRDLKNDFALEKMSLYDTGQNLIKSFSLHTSQSGAADGYNYNPPYIDPNIIEEGTQRLRLDSISVFDVNSINAHRYGFEYNPLKLPQRFSRSIDYFGYYNGYDNDDLIPRARYRPGVPTGYYGKANRSVNPNYTQAEILTKIVYPTGGNEEFVWENNYVGMFSGIESDLYRDHLMGYTKVFHSSGCMFEDTNPSDGYDFSMPIDIPQHSDGIMEFDITIEGCPVSNGIQVLGDTNCSYSLFLIDLTDAPNSPQPLLEPKFIKFLTPGNSYKIAATYNGDFQGCGVTQTQLPNEGGFQAIIKYTEDPTPEEYIHSGLRIKELKAYNSNFDSVPSLWKSYEYVNPDNAPAPGLSSGMAYLLSLNHMRNYRPSCYAPNDPGTIKISSNTLATPVTGSSLVGYRYVKESFMGPSSSNGYKLYQYSNLDSNAGYPYGTAYFNSPFPKMYEKSILPIWRNGNLLKATIFDKDNNIKKIEEYLYEGANTFHRDSKDFSVQVFRMPNISITDPQVIFDNNIYVRHYGYTTEHHRLKSQTTTDYLDGGDVTVTQVHTYDNNP
ncbi:hypothetical protein, partial [Winogradskyella luteola]